MKIQMLLLVIFYLGTTISAVAGPSLPAAGGRYAVPADGSFQGLVKSSSETVQLNAQLRFRNSGEKAENIFWDGQCVAAEEFEIQNGLEFITSYLTVINFESGETVLTYAQLRKMADREFQKSGLGPVIHLDPYRILLSNKNAHVLFSVQGVEGQAVFDYDAKSSQMRILWSERERMSDRRGRQTPDYSFLADGRYALVTPPSSEPIKKRMIFDLHQDRVLRIATRSRVMDLSKSGDRLLYKDGSGKNQTQLISIEQGWSKNHSSNNVTYSLSELGPAVILRGYVLSRSEDFQRMVVDSDGLRGHPYSDTLRHPHLIPKLALVQLIGNRLTIEPLPEWDSIQKNIVAFAKQGVLISVLGLSSQMTPDGEYFAMQLTFTKNVPAPENPSVFLVQTQYALARWKLGSTEAPVQISSAVFDSTSPAAESGASFRTEKRPLSVGASYRLRDDGTLTFARALAAELQDTSFFNLHVHALRIEPNKVDGQDLTGRIRIYEIGNDRIPIGRSGLAMARGVRVDLSLDGQYAFVPLSDYGVLTYPIPLGFEPVGRSELCENLLGSSAAN
jgi:hypothetical protein